MSTNAAILEQNKALVKTFYEGGRYGELANYGIRLHPDFMVQVPDYLPWGGSSSVTQYLEVVLPQVGKALDFTRLSYESITADDDRVIVVISVGVTGTDSLIKVSEHWVVAGDKAISLWVAYYEPKALVDQLASSKKAQRE
jgi:hypothetical protein